MSRQSSGPSPAEREELARMMPVPTDRDLPAGRRSVLKEHLMQEIEQTSVASAPRRRRRLTAIAVPVAIAAAVATGFTVLGNNGAKPVQAAGGSSTKIVNANYTIEKERGGWVKVEVKVKPGVQLDQDVVRADFKRMGIPSAGIFTKDDPQCTAHQSWENQKKGYGEIADKVLGRNGTAKGGTLVWNIKPSAIPAGYYLQIVFTPVGPGGGAMNGPLIGVGEGIAKGTPPTCYRSPQTDFPKSAGSPPHKVG